MEKLTLAAASGPHAPAFVFETATGKVIAWFEEDMKARAFSASQNRQHGKGYSDWANTFVKLVQEARAS